MGIILLSILLLCVFVLPLAMHKIEENLEPFLLVCGVLAVTISGVWSGHLVKDALTEPVHITAAVLIVGLIFKKFHLKIRTLVDKAVDVIGLRWTMFFVVIVLGLASSIITAIVAALILSEVATVLCIKRSGRIKLIIYTCFAISVGAVLTPIGEPLGTIVLSKLEGPPHYADTMYILKLLWPYIIGATLFLGILAYRIAGKEVAVACEREEAFHSFTDIFIRAARVFIFVAALTFLGEGLKPLAYKTIYHLSAPVLYWVNIVSAVLDNATMAAIEIVPEMTERTLKFLLVSLIMGGGMLIPGNIPNIISASKLRIRSKEWAITAVPLGILLMAVNFVLLLIFA
ncbi:putative cation transporter [Parelusimicrobium proximum]|uniref:DUF1646 family protein n=1 Tax=Parelusimicrobium proximum TaxID=3228953 RepID=UPI003D182E11